MREKAGVPGAALVGLRRDEKRSDGDRLEGGEGDPGHRPGHDGCEENSLEHRTSTPRQWQGKANEWRVSWAALCTASLGAKPAANTITMPSAAAKRGRELPVVGGPVRGRVPLPGRGGGGGGHAGSPPRALSTMASREEPIGADGAVHRRRARITLRNTKPRFGRESGRSPGLAAGPCLYRSKRRPPGASPAVAHGSLQPLTVAGAAPALLGLRRPAHRLPVSSALGYCPGRTPVRATAPFKRMSRALSIAARPVPRVSGAK